MLARNAVLRCSVATAQRTPWERSGIGTAVDDHDPIDNDVLDTDRVVFGVLPRGLGLHRLGIEHDNIGLKTVTQEATVGETETLGGEGGHFADGLRESHLLLGPYELRQHDRKAAIGAWIGI